MEVGQYSFKNGYMYYQLLQLCEKTSKTALPLDGWMDDTRFYVPFNCTSVISGRWDVDNEKL